MLEEVLKSINSNLERIAKTLESKVKAPEIGVAGEKLACATAPENKNVVSIPVRTVEPLGNMPNPYNNQNTPQVANSTNTIPTTLNQVPAYVSVSTQTQIPIAPQEGFTQEQLAVAMSKASIAGKSNVIQGIFQQFGVQTLTQINPVDYNKVATMLKEAGVEV